MAMRGNPGQVPDADKPKPPKGPQFANLYEVGRNGVSRFVGTSSVKPPKEKPEPLTAGPNPVKSMRTPLTTGGFAPTGQTDKPPRYKKPMGSPGGSKTTKFADATDVPDGVPYGMHRSLQASGHQYAGAYQTALGEKHHLYEHHDGSKVSIVNRQQVKGWPRGAEKGGDNFASGAPRQHDEAAAGELENYITSHAGLYKQQHEPIIKNLIAKKAKGVYDSNLAHKLFGYLATNGAQTYHKEHGDPNQHWSKTFDTATRSEVARRLRDSFETEAGYGNYDHMVPKKYAGYSAKPAATKPAQGQPPAQHSANTSPRGTTGQGPDEPRAQGQGFITRNEQPSAPNKHNASTDAPPPVAKMGKPKFDALPGGKADKRTPASFDPVALAKGTRVEQEHTSDPDLAREIAMDHLAEDPAYYAKLAKVEGGKCGAKMANWGGRTYGYTDPHEQLTKKGYVHKGTQDTDGRREFIYEHPNGAKAYVSRGSVRHEKPPGSTGAKMAGAWGDEFWGPEDHEKAAETHRKVGNVNMAEYHEKKAKAKREGKEEFAAGDEGTPKNEYHDLLVQHGYTHEKGFEGRDTYRRAGGHSAHVGKGDGALHHGYWGRPAGVSKTREQLAQHLAKTHGAAGAGGKTGFAAGDPRGTPPQGGWTEDVDPNYNHDALLKKHGYVRVRTPEGDEDGVHYAHPNGNHASVDGMNRVVIRHKTGTAYARGVVKGELEAQLKRLHPEVGSAGANHSAVVAGASMTPGLKKPDGKP